MSRRLVQPRPQIDFAALGVLGEYLASCVDRGLRARTIESKHEVLTMVQRSLSCDLETASERLLRSWWRGLATDGVADTTRATYLSHVRTFYRWATREDFRPDDPTRRIDAPLRRRTLPRDVDPVRAIEVLDSLTGRDWWLVALPLHLGLRCAETAAVHPARELLERPSAKPVLRVEGKGGHFREVPVPPLLVTRLRQAPPGFLFPSLATRSGHLSPKYVSDLTAEVLRAAGLDATAHQLRHTYATTVANRTGDVTGLQRVLGHANLSTTGIYVHGSGAAITEAVSEGLYLPHQRVNSTMPEVAEDRPDQQQRVPGAPDDDAE